MKKKFYEAIEILRSQFSKNKVNGNIICLITFDNQTASPETVETFIVRKFLSVEGKEAWRNIKAYQV